jgi:fermentation-respiration switch protein FrsA (DUF1100 family)
VLALYLAVVALFYFNQRRLLYVADTRRVTPAEAGLGGFEAVAIPTPDGQTLQGWWRPPPTPGHGAVLYLHGNAGSLLQRRDRFEDMREAGLGVLAVSYRGYGGSTGQPSEAALIADARTVLDWLGRRTPAQRTAVFGESLGSGVAVALAAERQVGGLVLDSPYSSIERVAARLYPWLPVSVLAADRFNSEARIGRVEEPILISHCTDDRLIPVYEARRLVARAKEGRVLLDAVPGCAHVEGWAQTPARERMLAALQAFTQSRPWPEVGKPAPRPS